MTDDGHPVSNIHDIHRRGNGSSGSRPGPGRNSCDTYSAYPLTLLTVTLGVCPKASAQDSDPNSFRPLTQAMLNAPDPADWVMWRGGYGNWGYSPLDQIDRGNVHELRLVWSFAFEPAGPGSRGMQVEPLVYDGVM